MKKIFFVLCALILTNCAPPTTNVTKYKSLPSTPDSQKVFIYSPSKKPEQKYVVIGTASFNIDKQTYICEYSDMTNGFAKACRIIGGDAVMITEMVEPDFTSCYRGTADIIKFVHEDSYGKISRGIAKKYPPIPDSLPITTYLKSEKPNQEFQVLGFIDFEDTGNTFICDSTDMIEAFAKECRQIGGDAVQITDMKVPDKNSTCYRGSANIIKFVETKPTTVESKSTKTVPDSQEKAEVNKVPATQAPVTQAAETPTSTPSKKATPSRTIYVAVLETISHGVIKQNENIYLTDVLREEARRVLPAKSNYVIMTRENISTMLPPEKSIEECEGECLVETGRNIFANYVTQARINTYGSKITITVELYHTETGNLIASFNAKSDNIDDLEQRIREKAPSMFNEIKETTEK